MSAIGALEAKVKTGEAMTANIVARLDALEGKEDA